MYTLEAYLEELRADVERGLEDPLQIGKTRAFVDELSSAREDVKNGKRFQVIPIQDTDADMIYVNRLDSLFTRERLGRMPKQKDGKKREKEPENVLEEPEILVGKENGRPACAIWFAYSPPHYRGNIFVEKIYVAEQFRKKGYATALLEEAIELHHDHAGRVELHAPEHVIPYYLRIGFFKTYDDCHSDEGSDLTMVLPLTLSAYAELRNEEKEYHAFFDKHEEVMDPLIFSNWKNRIKREMQRKWNDKKDTFDVNRFDFENNPFLIPLRACLPAAYKSDK